jgi:hypothetical protein
MSHRFLKIVNSLLLAICAASIWYAIFRWDQWRPHVVVNPPLGCGEHLLGDQAHYAAYICKFIIERHGSLPANASDLGRAISDEMRTRWGPPDATDMEVVNSAGELRDCYGGIIQISVGTDRLTATSPSSYTFYFVGLVPPGHSNE